MGNERSRRWLALYLPIPALAVLITWLSGFWVSLGFYEHGFPLSWKVGGCPPPWSLAACFGVVYNWVFFLLDAVVYTTVGCAIVFAISRRQETALIASSAAPGAILYLKSDGRIEGEYLHLERA